MAAWNGKERGGKYIRGMAAEYPANDSQHRLQNMVRRSGQFTRSYHGDTQMSKSMMIFVCMFAFSNAQ